jgi:hypothetical protein
MTSIPSSPASLPNTGSNTLANPLPTPATPEQVAALPEVQQAESTPQWKLYSEMYAQQHDQWVRNPSSDPLGEGHVKYIKPFAQEENNAKVTQYMAPLWVHPVGAVLGSAFGFGIVSVTLRNKVNTKALAKLMALPIGFIVLGITAFGMAVQKKLNERYKHMIALNGGDPNTTLAQGREAMKAHGEDPTLKPFLPYIANYTISPF